MATSIIKNRSTSFLTIKQDVQAYLEGLSNFDEIKDQLPASNLTLIENLIAGFGAFISQRQNLYREETYLSKAKMATSVYEIANTFGYSINRYTAPSVKIKYNAIPTISVRSGDILGSYNGKDVVYFGPNKILEKLDTLDVFIGSYQESDIPVEFTDGVFILDVSPVESTSVDRDNITCFINDVEQSISQAIEDYIVFNNIADYSLDPYSARLFISDIDNSYGIVAEEGSSCKIKYLETDGKIENLKLSDITLNSEYLAVSVNHVGTNGDSLEKIKQLAPLLYSTLRRMVTEKDHKYLAEAHPLIASAAAERDLGQPYEATIDLTGDYTSDTFEVVINGVNYSYTGQAGDTKSTATQALYDVISAPASPYFLVTLDTVNDLITVVNADARNLDFLVTSVTNTTVDNTVVNEKPACCTVNLYYVASQTVDEPYFLTDYERSQLANYLNKFKMVGLKIILVPAVKDGHDLSIKIKLTDSALYNATKAAIESVKSEYEMKLDKGFDYGEFLVKVSQVRVFNSEGILVSPVTSVVPNQTVFNVSASKYQYIKFDTVEILLE